MNGSGGSVFESPPAHTSGACAAAGGKLELAAFTAEQRRALATLLERLSPAGWERTASLVKLFLGN